MVTSPDLAFLLPCSPVPIIVGTPARFHSDVLPVSQMTRTPPISSSKPRPSAPVASYSLASPSSICVSDAAAVSSSTVAWHPLSPFSPEPVATLDQIRSFLASRSDAPANSKHLTVTQKFHDVTMTDYLAILRGIFPGEDAHPQHPRYPSFLSSRSSANRLTYGTINYFSDR